MSGITLSAKDLKKDLRILDVILLKIFFNKEKEMFEALKEYYDSNLLSNMMAPFFPEHSRNTLWVLKRKDDDLF